MVKVTRIRCCYLNILYTNLICKIWKVLLSKEPIKTKKVFLFTTDESSHTFIWTVRSLQSLLHIKESFFTETVLLVRNLAVCEFKGELFYIQYLYDITKCIIALCVCADTETLGRKQQDASCPVMKLCNFYEIMKLWIMQFHHVVTRQVTVVLLCVCVCVCVGVRVCERVCVWRLVLTSKPVFGSQPTWPMCLKKTGQICGGIINTC